MGKGLIAVDGEDEGAKKAKAKMLKKATGGRGVAFTAAKETGKGEADDDNDDDEDSEDGDFEAGLIAAVFARTPHAAYLRARQMQPRTLLRVQFSLRRAPCALGTGAWLCAAGSRGFASKGFASKGGGRMRMIAVQMWLKLCCLHVCVHVQERSLIATRSLRRTLVCQNVVESSLQTLLKALCRSRPCMMPKP